MPTDGREAQVTAARPQLTLHIVLKRIPSNGTHELLLDGTRHLPILVSVLEATFCASSIKKDVTVHANRFLQRGNPHSSTLQLPEPPEPHRDVESFTRRSSAVQHWAQTRPHDVQ